MRVDDRYCCEITSCRLYWWWVENSGSFDISRKSKQIFFYLIVDITCILLGYYLYIIVVTLLFNLKTNLSLASKTWWVEAWFDKSRSQQSEESTSMITSTSCPWFWGLSTLNTKFIFSSFLQSRNKDKKLQETIINNLEEIRYMKFWRQQILISSEIIFNFFWFGCSCSVHL